MDMQLLSSYFYGPFPRWFRYLAFSGVVLSGNLLHSVSVIDYYFLSATPCVLNSLLLQFQLCHQHLTFFLASLASSKFKESHVSQLHTQPPVSFRLQLMIAPHNFKSFHKLAASHIKNMRLLILSFPSLYSFFLHKSTKAFCSELFLFEKDFLVLKCFWLCLILSSYCCLRNISNDTLFFYRNSHSQFCQPSEGTIPSGPQDGLENGSQQKHPSGFTHSEKIPLTPERVTHVLKPIKSDSLTQLYISEVCDSSRILAYVPRSGTTTTKNPSFLVLVQQHSKCNTYLQLFLFCFCFSWLQNNPFYYVLSFISVLLILSSVAFCCSLEL